MSRVCFWESSMLFSVSHKCSCEVNVGGNQTNDARFFGSPKADSTIVNTDHLAAHIIVRAKVF